MNREEEDIQRTLFQHVAARPMPGVVIWHCPNGGKRPKKEAAILKGLGVRAGIPDINAVKAGCFYALELKSRGGVLRQSQIDMHAELRRAGVVVGVADTLNDALLWLEGHGLVRGRLT